MPAPSTLSAPLPASQGEAEDRSISMVRANVIGFALLPVMVAATLIPFSLLHGWHAVAEGWDAAMNPFWFFVLWIAGSVVLHEGLHGLGFIAGGAPRAAVRFGFNVRSVTPFATCEVPLNARAYRMSALLPALLLGVIPFVISLATGIGWLAIVAMWMLATAVGDFMIVWMIRDVPAAAFVRDHQSRAGCHVLRE